MKLEDVRTSDIIQKKGDDKFYVVIFTSPGKIVAQHTADIWDLTDWEKVDFYGRKEPER